MVCSLVALIFLLVKLFVNDYGQCLGLYSMIQLDGKEIFAFKAPFLCNESGHDIAGC